MASESESWWANNYTSYSIRDLQLLPIYNRFSVQHFPYERTCEDRSESFTEEDTISVFQWHALNSHEGEKFSLDKAKDLWFYERKFRTEDAKVTARTWLSPEAEWGELEHQYQNFVVKENWKLKDSTRNYERYSIQNGEKRGLKTGSLPSQGGLEHWTATSYEKDGESEYEKVWERPGATGGESKHSQGDYWWGEVWHRAGSHNEKKSWHTRGDKEWGHVHGEAPNKVWDESWDISKTKREEEKLTKDNGRFVGYRVKRNGDDYYKQEWDGLAILGVEEGVEQLKTAEVRQALEEICSSRHDLILKGEHTVELLLRAAPQFKPEVEELKKERVAIPKPNNQDVYSLISAIRAEREHADKLERLKQRMIDTLHTDHGKFYELPAALEQALCESYKVLSQIADNLKTDAEATKNAADWAKKIDDLRKATNVSPLARALSYIEGLKDIEKSKLTSLEVAKEGSGVSLPKLPSFLSKVNKLVHGKIDLEEIAKDANEEALTSAIAELESLVDALDAQLQLLDQQLDESLKGALENMKKDAKTATEGLLQRHYASEDGALLAAKVSQLNSLAGIVKNLKDENEELEQIIDQKSDEITSISTLMDEEKRKTQVLEDEVLTLRKKT